jgi:hypothetical protein
MGVNEVSDERFEEVYSLVDGAAQLSDGGRTFGTVKIMCFQCALGKNSYSSGIHRIRIKLHHGSAFVGVRSRHIRVVTDEFLMAGQYQNSPSTYGWYTHGGRVVNGRFDERRIDVSNKADVIVELTLNCDERRLTIVISKDSIERDEMEVDGLHAPFPWCLFVQLSRVGACISLV